jgi:polyisoprenoid-binding protein YceI
MLRRCRIAAVVTAALVPALAAQEKQAATQPAGGPQTYQVDPVHSSTWFRIRHMDVADFYGRFNEIQGTLVLDDANPAACALEAQIKVDSVDTHNADRDKHLKSADFFDAQEFPLITFKSTGPFRKTGADTHEVQGDLTLHGVTRPLTLELTRTGVGPGMKGETRAGFETTFAIKRSDFAVGKPAGLGDDVRLTISVETVRK